MAAWVRRWIESWREIMAEMNTTSTTKGWGTAPFPVAVAAAITLCKGGLLLAFGLLGLAAQDSVSNPWGGGMIVLGLLFALLGWLLPRGISVARYGTALLAAASAVIAIVWAINAPSSVVVEPIFMLIFAVGVLALLFVPDATKAYFTAI